MNLDTAPDILQYLIIDDKVSPSTSLNETDIKDMTD